MRSVTNGNSLVPVTAFECKVYNGSAWVDIASRVRTTVLRYAHNSGRWTAELEVINTPSYRDANKSLDPGHTSDYNPGGVPLLGAYHDVKISIGKNAAAVPFFEGYVGPSDIRGMESVEGEDILGASAVDILQPYADYWIDVDEGRTYEETYIKASENVLNTILADYGFAPVVVLQDDPSYYLYRYEIGDTNMLEILQNPIHSIGYVLMTKWSASEGAFRPTVVDPQRDNTTPDIIIGGDLKVIYTTYTEANVRTKVRWVYKDRDTGKEASVIAADEGAKALYGIPDGQGGRLHRYMRVVMTDLSTVDTRAEAQIAANRALFDLSHPCPGVQVEIPWLALNVEGGDLIQFTTRTETVTVGVTGITHRLSTADEKGMIGQTTIEGVLNYRVGNQRYWLLRGRTDLLGKLARDYYTQHGKWPEPPANIHAEGEWGESNDSSAAPLLFINWSGYRDWTTKGYEVKLRQAKEIDTGTADSGGTNSLIDSSKAWIRHEFMGYYVYLKGTGRGGEDQVRLIIDNDATTITWRDSLDTAVAAAEEYAILKPTTDWQAIRCDRYPFTQVEGLPSGVYTISKVRTVPFGVGR